MADEPAGGDTQHGFTIQGPLLARTLDGLMIGGYRSLLNGRDGKILTLIITRSLQPNHIRVATILIARA